MSCLFKYYVNILGGGWGSWPKLIMLTQGGWGVWNNGKHGYIILAHSPIYLRRMNEAVSVECYTFPLVVMTSIDPSCKYFLIIDHQFDYYNDAKPHQGKYLFWVLLENDLYVVGEKPLGFGMVTIEIDDDIILEAGTVQELMKRYRAFSEQSSHRI